MNVMREEEKATQTETCGKYRRLFHLHTLKKFLHFFFLKREKKNKKRREKKFFIYFGTVFMFMGISRFTIQQFHL